jgi:hypothetical protein
MLYKIIYIHLFLNMNWSAKVEFHKILQNLWLPKPHAPHAIQISFTTHTHTCMHTLYIYALTTNTPLVNNSSFSEYLFWVELYFSQPQISILKMSYRFTKGEVTAIWNPCFFCEKRLLSDFKIENFKFHIFRSATLMHFRLFIACVQLKNTLIFDQKYAPCKSYHGLIFV